MDFIESTSLNTANFPLQSKLSSAEFLTPVFIYASLLPHRDEAAIVYVKTTFCPMRVCNGNRTSSAEHSFNVLVHMTYARQINAAL